MPGVGDNRADAGDARAERGDFAGQHAAEAFLRDVRDSQPGRERSGTGSPAPCSGNDRILSNQGDPSASEGCMSFLDLPEVFEKGVRWVKENERKHLEELVKKAYAGDRDRVAKVHAFFAAMDKFEDRVRKNHLGDVAVVGTYVNLSRLLEKNDSAPISATGRLHLAEDVIRQESDLSNICQGDHFTCNVTSVESRMYAKYPAQAAGLVADIATTGQFKTASGSIVKLEGNNLKPDLEAQSSSRGDDRRSYASELFQIAAVNVYWSSQGASYGKSPADINREGLTRDGKFSRSPKLKLSNLDYICNQISGYTDEHGYLVDRTYMGYPQVLQARNARELLRQLEGIEHAGKLPAILLVKTEPQIGCEAGPQGFTLTATASGDTGEPDVDADFSNRRPLPLAVEDDADHVVTVRKLVRDHRTGKVYAFVDGEWGKRQHGWVEIDTLFGYLD